MADGKLVFPVRFDLEAAVKEAEKDTEGFLNRMDSILKNRPIKLNTEVQEFDELSASLKSLNENLVRLNTLMSTMGHVTVVAQEQATQSIQEHGRVTADTTNTIQRQLMVQERVNKTLRDTYTEQEHVAQLISKYHDTYEDQVASLVRLNQQLAANKKAQSDNAKALKDGSATQAEYNKRQLELVAQQRQLSQAKSELTQIMRAEEKAMMVAEGSYEQLSQQLSLLKRAYKELSEEGRTSPFGQELEAAIQNLDANLKDMAADIGEFQRNVGNYAIAGQNGVVATESLTAALNQEARTTQDLVDQSKILEEAKRMLNREDANYEATISQINAQLEENRRKLADVSDILGKDAKSVAEAEAQNKRLSEALKQVDLTSAGAKKKLEEIRAQIERNNKTISEATGANEKYADSLLKMVGVNANLGSSLQTLGQGGNFIDGLKIKTEAFAKTLMGLLSNPWVLTFLGIAGLGAAFKWWYEYNKGLIEASRLTENFTGLTGQAADKATADMQALADHMGKGYRETINAANALVQQFGVSWKDAMELMQEGVTAGADMSGNMLSNIERFAPALRDAGVTADEFMSILAETRSGLFNEQGIQLAVRGGTRLRAMTKQIAASLDAVGISSKQMQKDLSDGTMTMFQAVQKVAAKLKELPENSQEAGNIMKHVFGRVAAEGGTLLIQSIADVNTNLDKAKESMGELGEVNDQQMNAQRELNETLMAVFKMSGTSFEKMTIRAKTFVTQGLTMIIRGLADIANWFIRIYNNSMIVRAAVNSQIAAFENVWAVAKYTLKNIIGAFKSVGKIIEGVVTLDVNKIGEGWKEGMAAIGNNALNFAKKIASNTAKAYNNTLKGELKEISKLLPDEELDETKPKTTPSKKSITPITEEDKNASKSYLQTLNKIEQSLSTINSKYNELAKKEGNAKALEHINELYKTQLAYVNQLGRQFGLSFKMPTSFKDIQDYRKAILDVINKLKGLGVKGADTAALELEMKIGLGNVDKESKNIEAELKKLADRISRTKTAREFYDKILSQTGDVEMAGTLTMDVFGDTGADLFNQTVAQIEKYFSGIEVELPINFNTEEIDYKKLRRIWEADKALPDNLRKIPEAYDSAIKQILDSADSSNRKMIEGWLKATEKAKTYGDKLADVYRKTATEIEAIQKKMDSGQLDKSVGSDLIAGFKRKEAEEIANLQYEAFKDSPMYVQMFDDLDHASTRMLKNMKARLISLQGEWKNLDPTQLKELQSRLNEIDAQLVRRNPFKTLADGMREYYNLRTKGDARGNKSRKDADNDMLKWTEEYIRAQEQLAKVMADKNSTKEQIAVAASLVDYTKRQKEEAEKVAGNWKKVEDAIGLSTNELMQMLNWAGDIARAVADISEALGADEEDVQYWNTVADSLSNIAGGIQDIVSAAMSGNVVGVISSTLTAIPKMFVGFVNLFNAGRIRKANKEIKRQQEILEQLEYTYSRLQTVADKLFGRDYISNYNQQLSNLQAQAQAYQKQAEAEKSKGKKTDKEKLKEYENAYRDMMDQIADMQTELVEKFTGTSKTDAARQMAQSWIEARASLSDTYAAIAGDYKEMIKNMLVEGAAARVIENALTPMWDKMDAMLKDNNIEGAIDSLVGGMDEALNAANNGMEVLWKALEARGYDMKQLIGDTDESYTGIAKSVANATSEEINANTAALNTQNYYMSGIPGIASNVTHIVELLRSGIQLPTNISPDVDFATYHASSLAQLGSLNNHAAQILTECQRSAMATEETAREVRNIAEKLNRVVTYQGGNFVVNTALKG